MSSHPEPLARKLIRSRYVERGSTTRVVVAPYRDSGLPEALVDRAEPVTLDLLAGRPINLALDDDGIAADLCFGGPPVRCRFPWGAVLAVQDEEGSLAQTLTVTVAIVMDDGSLALTADDRSDEPTAADEPASSAHLAVIDGPPRDSAPAPVQERTGNVRSRLRIVTNEEADEG